MGHKKPVRIDPLTKALPHGGVDSHAHLDSVEFKENMANIISLAERTGIEAIGNVFLGPEAYKSGKILFEEYPFIFFILGVHPHDAEMFTAECQNEMEDIFKTDGRVRAMGEIGLDYHYDHAPRELQRQVFAKQLEMAKKIEKPVVIHCRDAEYDCLTLLEAGGFQDYPLLWHCFGGDRDLAGIIVRNGWHISIPGSVTYPPNVKTQEAVKNIPPGRLLLETDCPYLSPVPWRGTINQPGNLVFTARFVADLRGENPDELWVRCGENAKRFFGLA